MANATSLPGTPALAAATLLLLSSLTVTPTTQAASNPQLIKDVNTLPLERQSLCGQPVAVNGVAFFCAANYELWQSDGTEAGTKPVKLPDGQIVTDAYDLVASGGWLYFTQGNQGTLSRTDGSPQGTVKIVDSEGRPLDAELLTDVDGELYFFEFNRDLSFLHELWKTDGTEAGTVQVKLFDPRLNPNDAVAVNGELFFTNYDHQLWKSDGTAAGTVLLRDIEWNNYRDEDNNLTNVDGMLYFSMESVGYQHDLWKSDGTTAGTVRVKQGIAAPNMDVGDFTNVDGTLFFTAESNYSDSIVWISDGTTTGTQPVLTLPDYRHDSIAAAGLGNQYIFGQRQGLWRTDGTDAGTQQLASDIGDSYVDWLTVHRGRVYFSANNGSGLGYELWATNGSLAGTQLVSDIAWQDRSSSPHYFESLDAGLIFEANKGKAFGGDALWISDGTDAGTEQVKDISQFTYGAYPSASVRVGEAVYFLANQTRVPTTNQQWELWKTDGSAAGTQLALDLIAEPTGDGEYYGGEFAFLEGLNNLLYVSGRDTTGWGMWRTNGTPTGTEKLPNVVPGTPSRPLSFLTNLNEKLYFFAATNSGDALRRLGPAQTVSTLLRDGLANPGGMQVLQNQLIFINNVDELWRSDGTAAGTQKIKSLGLGPDAVIDTLQEFGNGFIFRARWDFDYYEGPRNVALWFSDGTAAGTYQLRDYYPADLLITDSRMYFGDAEGLWVSDGTLAGTKRILARGDIQYLTEVDGTVYFSVETQFLWKTNGTAAGTVEVARELYITGMTQLNGQLYFTAYQSAGYYSYYTNTGALRKSDGTAAGTVIVAPEIASLGAVNVPQQDVFLARKEQEIYGSTPWQFWRTDGTEAGTRQLSEFQSYASFGPFYGEPPTEIYLGEQLIFVVDDGTHGAELWNLNLAEAAPAGGFIGDFVWQDNDADGVQDNDEPGLADVYVELEDCDGNAIRSALSGSDGGYGFEELAAGSYQLRFTLPTGYAFSPMKAGSDYTLDSNADPETGLVSCRTLAEGQNRRGLDAGLVIQQTGSIGDRVWHDLDADGVQDTGEQGFAGALVSLESCTGTLLQTTATNNDGSYAFESLEPGDYRVRFSMPAGYTFSPAKASGDYRTDSNADAVTGLTSCRSIAESQNRRALDAGLVPARPPG